MALGLAGVVKGEVIPDSVAPKSNFLYLSRTIIEPSVRIRGLNWRQEKLASRKVSSLASWLLKFYQVKNNWRKIQLRILLKRTLKKTRNLMNSETFRQNKKKRRILKFKELCFPDTLSDKFQQIALKFATLYLFYPFLSYFFCVKFLFKNFIICVIFSNQYPN